ncbi:hypothetical protein BJX70DRAFT_39695 [Aspergillus crustosus]
MSSSATASPFSTASRSLSGFCPVDAELSSPSSAHTNHPSGHEHAMSCFSTHLPYMFFFCTLAMPFQAPFYLTRLLIHRYPNVGRFSYVSVIEHISHQLQHPKTPQKFSFWSVLCTLLVIFSIGNSCWSVSSSCSCGTMCSVGRQFFVNRIEWPPCAYIFTSTYNSYIVCDLSS